MENNTEFRNIRGTDYETITGWGIDADPENDPTYPMKVRTNEEHKGYSWDRPPQQPIDVEVLHSIERPNVTAVFGVTVPPNGLSGMIRRYAFKYSESSYGHWLPLLIADRVNVVEGIVDDLRRGRIPNIFAERGMKASWKYDRDAVIQKIAVGALLASTFIALMYSKKKLRRS